MFLKLLFICIIVKGLQINFNTLQNEPIYFLQSGIWNKLYFTITKNTTIQLIENEPWYGYINNPCLKSYSCCRNNVSLTKHFNKNNCSNILMSSCYGYTALVNECYDSFHCERYNSSTYVKYLYSFDKIEDINCFFKYQILEYKIKENTNLLNYSINVDDFYDDITEIQIKGITSLEKNNTHSFFRCDKYNNKDINIFYYNLNLFKEFDDIIKTEYIDCKTDENTLTLSNFFDKNNEKYNKLNYINGIFTNNIIQTIINVNLTFNITNMVKEKNKGCLITNIEENNYNFFIEVNCFEDTFKYISFDMCFLNDKKPTKCYFIEKIIDNNYTFYLNSRRLPDYFINYIGEQPINILHKNTKRFIEPIKSYDGDVDYTQDNNYISGYTIFAILSIISFIIIVLYSLFTILYVCRCGKFAKLIEREHYKVIEELTKDNTLLNKKITFLEQQIDLQRINFINSINNDIDLKDDVKKDIISMLNINQYGTPTGDKNTKSNMKNKGNVTNNNGNVKDKTEKNFDYDVPEGYKYINGEYVRLDEEMID